MNKRNKTRIDKDKPRVDLINNGRKVKLTPLSLSTNMNSFLHESILSSQLQKLQKKTKIKT